MHTVSGYKLARAPPTPLVRSPVANSVQPARALMAALLPPAMWLQQVCVGGCVWMRVCLCESFQAGATRFNTGCLLRFKLTWWRIGGLHRCKDAPVNVRSKYWWTLNIRTERVFVKAEERFSISHRWSSVCHRQGTMWSTGPAGGLLQCWSSRQCWWPVVLTSARRTSRPCWPIPPSPRYLKCVTWT